MSLDWTPWFDVALHRRLEVLSVAFYMFQAIFLGPISAVTIIYLLVSQFFQGKHCLKKQHKTQLSCICMRKDSDTVSAS